MVQAHYLLHALFRLLFMTEREENVEWSKSVVVVASLNSAEETNNDRPVPVLLD